MNQLDAETLRERFNIDQQKSNKAADTPRESQLGNNQSKQNEAPSSMVQL